MLPLIHVWIFSIESIVNEIDDEKIGPYSSFFKLTEMQMQTRQFNP